MLSGQVSRADAFVPPKPLKMGVGHEAGRGRKMERGKRGRERILKSKVSFPPFTEFSSDVNAVTGNQAVPPKAKAMAKGSSKDVQGACHESAVSAIKMLCCIC